MRAGGAQAAWVVGATVIGGAFVDMALGLAILWRVWCMMAKVGMIAVSGAYLTGGTLSEPELWLDPLGPLAHVASIVVLADTVFTATAAIIQTITRFLLERIVGWPVSEGWVALSLLLYGFVGIFWLPVVWMQMRMRNLARAAQEAGPALPKTYHGLYRWWFAFGFPAFAAVMAIVWLMLTVPNIGR